MIISITGTPGAGKTYFAKRLAKIIGFRYFDLNSFIKEERLYDRFDRKAKTFDVDTKKLKKFLDMILRKFRFNAKDPSQKRMMRMLTKQQDKRFTLNDYIRGCKFLSSKKNAINNIIIDSHLSHYMKADFCFVIKNDINRLSKRLKKRGYNRIKIKDNLESEIFDICLEEAKTLKNNIIIIDN